MSVHIPAHSVRLVPLLALWMSLAVGIPVAIGQQDVPVWSIQFDGGLFAPIEASSASPMVGLRYCRHYGSHLQGGMLSGWMMKSKKLQAPADGVQGNESLVELARFDAHLLPVMGFMQVDLTARSRLVPFAGFGAGYEWLTLEATDHRTGLKTSASYGNVAWETYAGMGLRLTSEVRLNGELYYNGGSLERDVVDASGRAWREAVNVNAVGVRVGVDSKFR
jgi:hypothetical protein